MEIPLEGAMGKFHAESTISRCMFQESEISRFQKITYIPIAANVRGRKVRISW